MEQPVPEKCPHCGGRHYSWNVQVDCEWRSYQARQRAEREDDMRGLAYAEMLAFEAGLAADGSDLRGLVDSALGSTGHEPAWRLYVDAARIKALRMQMACRNDGEQRRVDVVVTIQLARLAEAAQAAGGAE